MSNARDKANIPALNFSSTGIDDNATSTAITIDSSGDVGIGTSTIQNQASGRTVLQLENTSTAMLNLGINGTRRGYLFSSSSDLSLVATTSTPLFFGTNGTERMRITSTGNVGIGTSSPSNLLHLSSDTPIPLKLNRTTNADTYISFKNTTDEWTAGLDTSEGFVIANGSFITTNPRFLIDSSGNVGIGTTSPVSVGGSRTGLQVSGGTNGGVLSLNNLGSEGDNPRIVGKVSGTTDMGFYAGGSSGELMFFTNNATERMRIDSSGNVGIGTSSPSRPLHVLSSGSTTVQLERTAVGSESKLLLQSATSFNAIYSRNGADSDKDFAIYTGSNERMRIDSSGNIIINGTSAYALNALTIQEDGNLSPQLIFKTDYGATKGHQYFINNNTTVGSIESNTSSTSFNTSSDYRLKENVSYDFDATTRLKQLKPARFNFIADADTIVDGFLAHEVSSVVPEAISGEKDAIETYTDDDGNEQTRPVYQGIDQSKLVPLLVKTIQELEARITALETNNP